MTDLSLTPTEQVVHPTTGELLAPDSPPQDLASYLEASRDLEWQLRARKKLVTAWLVDQMDQAVLAGRERNWTQHLEGGLTVSCPASARGVEYDGAELFTALMGLVDEGVIGLEAAQQAVEQIVTFKVNRQPLKKLMQASERVAAVADECGHPVDVERRVSVKQGGTGA